MSDSTIHPFIQYLVNLKQNENRGAMAHLRRGLGKKPGTVAEMYPYVSPWLNAEMPRGARDNYYIVASLFALHGEHQQGANLGGAFHQVWVDSDKSASIEKRFVNLLNANREELPNRLRHIVSLLKSRQVQLDFDRLFKDLRWWDSEFKSVQEHWARSFWTPENNSNTKKGD